MKKYQQKYDEVSNDLINKYEEIDKAEKSFESSIKKTEELIIEIYKNKRKIQNVKNGKLKMNDNELKVLNDKTKEYESQKESLINATKKFEKEYKNIIKNSSTSKYENKFATVINDCINGVKSVCGELTDKTKDTIITFLSSIRDSFKVPLDLSGQ
jgi:DNA repair ATPase RecN